jgi:L-iduronidase
MLRLTVVAVLFLLVKVDTAGAVELTADFSKKVSNLTSFWNGGGWDNEQVVDTESEKYNWMFDIDPKNTQCIYQQEQIVGTIPGGDFYQRPTMPMSNFTVRGLETGTPTYDWSKLDTWLDVVVRSGNRLVFELMLFPKGWPLDKYATYNEFFTTDQTLRWWKRLVTDVALHLESRYGAETVRNWYFETWNEAGTVKEGKDRGYMSNWRDQTVYNNYYDACSEGLLAADPKLKLIGGCQVSGTYVVEGIIAHCDAGRNYFTGATGVRLDGVSFHHKTTPRNQVAYANQIINWAKANHPRIYQRLLYWNDEADPEGNWRITTPDREHHATPWFAAYVAAQATQAKLATINALGVDYRFQNDSTFLGTHWFNRTHTMQFGGNKLETTKADEPAQVADNFALIKKPLHNVHTMLWLLGDTQVSFSPGANDQISGLVTRRGNAQVAVLVYNYTDQQFDTVYPVDSLDVRLKLVNLPFSSGKIVEYRIDKDHGNTYQQWRNMGSPTNPTDAQIQQLRDGQELGTVGNITDLKSTSVTLNLKLPRCGVSLLLLSADPGALPPRVTGLFTTRYRALSSERDDVMAKWSDTGSRLIKTYEVYKSDTADGPYTRVNTPDIICTGFTCPVRLGAKAFFKVRAVDYWGRSGAFSDVAIAEEQ